MFYISKPNVSALMGYKDNQFIVNLANHEEDNSSYYEIVSDISPIELSAKGIMAQMDKPFAQKTWIGKCGGKPVRIRFFTKDNRKYYPYANTGMGIYIPDGDKSILFHFGHLELSHLLAETLNAISENFNIFIENTLYVACDGPGTLTVQAQTGKTVKISNPHKYAGLLNSFLQSGKSINIEKGRMRIVEKDDSIEVRAGGRRSILSLEGLMQLFICLQAVAMRMDLKTVFKKEKKARQKALKRKNKEEQEAVSDTGKHDADNTQDKEHKEEQDALANADNMQAEGNDLKDEGGQGSSSQDTDQDALAETENKQTDSNKQANNDIVEVMEDWMV